MKRNPLTDKVIVDRGDRMRNILLRLLISTVRGTFMMDIDIKIRSVP